MPPEPADITAAILAGGEGRRVDGRDKGLLPLGGRPLVAHVRDAIAAQAGVILICANRHHDAYAAFGRVIGDAIAGRRGPLAGIAAALEACATTWLLTVPVDCPDPPPDLAARLHAQIGAADAATACVGGRREPLFALYRRGLAASARVAAAAEFGVWHWQDAAGAIEVDFSGRSAQFDNLNTIADFARWENRCHD